MPDRCCVPNCRSNYDGTGIYVSAFKFPKDKELHNLWCRKICRKDWTPSSRSVVCEKHFDPGSVIKFDELPRESGNIKIMRSHPKLQQGAYPKIFLDCPKYLTEKTVTPRESRTDKLERIDEIQFQNFTKSDTIASFDNLVCAVGTKLDEFCLSPKPEIIKTEEALFFLYLDLSTAPRVVKSIKINKDLCVNVFAFEKASEISKYKNILQSTSEILHFWSELENLLIFVKNITEASTISKNDVQLAIDHWKKSLVETDSYTKQQFMLEQMILSEKSKSGRRYSTDLIIFAFSLLMKSTSCYFTLYKSQLLSIPSIDHLQRMTGTLKLKSSITDTCNMQYIKEKCNKLHKNDKLVNLLLDEIHVKQKVSYKGQCLSGFAENHDMREATSIQAFMIASVFSKYKEIIALVPVTKLTADELYDLTCKTLKLLEEAGFSVLCIISDNNSINRNMFKMMGSTEESDYVQNPANLNENLFLFFDSVHLLKSIRNNWLTQLDFGKTFLCPGFGTGDPFSPSFQSLRKINSIEKASLVKLGHKLTFKSLYPSSIEKQNVDLALKIFHEGNSAALKILCKSNFIPNAEDTTIFLDIIRKWWNIMNISHLKKGIFLRCEDSKPFVSLEDERFLFLETFVQWLDKWKNMKYKPRCGVLSDETLFALRQTTKVMTSVIKHLLCGGTRYVLTKKFQTDNIEARFSMYRQMSGGNYHVSVQQILESERKIRLQSVLQLHSSSYGSIPLRSFLFDVAGTSETVVTDEESLSPFRNIIETVIDLGSISTNDAQALTYIAGYCIHNFKNDCQECQYYCHCEHEISVDQNIVNCSYLELVNRGGLKFPSQDIISVILTCYLITQKLLSQDYEKLFTSSKVKQHPLLCAIFCSYLKKNNVAYFDENCPLCETPLSTIIIMAIQKFSNICLNNYSKKLAENCLQKKDESKQNKNSDRKLKKFKKS